MLRKMNGYIFLWLKNGFEEGISNGLYMIKYKNVITLSYCEIEILCSSQSWWKLGYSNKWEVSRNALRIKTEVWKVILDSIHVAFQKKADNSRT